MNPSPRPLNLAALSIPRAQLLEAVRERIAAKQAILQERDRRWGKERVRVESFMANFAWPKMLEFDMNQRYADPDLHFDLSLREKIFWADNSDDDTLPDLNITATQGMYFDMTLLGLGVTYAADSIPTYAHHPLADRQDLSVFQPHDFQTTGVMPELLRQHRRLLELAQGIPDLQISFPRFYRGPLDLYVQMRTYEGFLDDTMDRPEFLSEALAYLVQERGRWNRERLAYLGLTREDWVNVDDDWLNIPLISPTIARDFAFPAYRQIEKNEGAVKWFHTCGILLPVVKDLLETFPHLRLLDVSGWNDFEKLHEYVAGNIDFHLNFINTFVLSGSESEHREALAKVARVARGRKISICAQSIVPLHGSYEDDLGRMNRFIALAREVLYT